VTIVDQGSTPVYLEIGPEAQHLRELGMSDRSIARAIGVSDKTVAKSLQGLHAADSFKTADDALRHETTDRRQQQPPNGVSSLRR
jgi:IS30 family transposase